MNDLDLGICRHGSCSHSNRSSHHSRSKYRSSDLKIIFGQWIAWCKHDSKIPNKIHPFEHPTKNYFKQPFYAILLTTVILTSSQPSSTTALQHLPIVMNRSCPMNTTDTRGIFCLHLSVEIRIPTLKRTSSRAPLLSLTKNMGRFKVRAH